MTLYEKSNLTVTFLACVAAGIAAAVYLRQLWAMQQSASAQNILAIINLLQAEHVRNARRIVLKELANRPHHKWSPEQERAAALVGSSYDVAAFLIRQGLVPVGKIVENWGPSVRNCYGTLEGYIAEMRREEHCGASHWDDFEWLRAKCQERPGR